MERQATRVLRSLILVEWLMVVGGVAFELYLETKLPTPLQEEIEMQDNAITAVEMVVFTPFLFVWLVATIGVFRLWPPARVMYAAVTVVGIASMPAFGHLIVHAWAVPMHEASSVVPGLIIALLYFSPAAGHFNAHAREPAA